MTNQRLAKRIISAVLVLVMVVGVCPIQAFAVGTHADVPDGSRLPFTQVEDVHADVLHEAAKVTQPEEEVPYADTDVVRVSIVLNKWMWLTTPPPWPTVPAWKTSMLL